jgi:hypothetical protein
VVGWGRVSEGGNLADIVQEVQVPILSLAQCRASKYRPQRITANMICAGKGVEDSCQVGDVFNPDCIINIFGFAVQEYLNHKSKLVLCDSNIIVYIHLRIYEFNLKKKPHP